MRRLLLIMTTFSLIACSGDENAETDVYGVTDTDSYLAMKVQFGDDIQFVKEENGQSVFFAESSIIENLSKKMHQVTNRCGGFFAYESAKDAVDNIQEADSFRSFENLNDYDITKTDFVNALTQKVEKEKQ